MLTKRFYDVWFLGRLDDVGVEKLKKYLFEAVKNGEERLRIRIYVRDGEEVSYLDELKKVLLENVLLSIVVESREIEKFAEDLESHRGEVALIINSPPISLDLIRFRGKSRIIGGMSDG